ncbi:MAG: hypothetical protein AAB652_00315 [Patescibacteria group bacterium]
MELLELLKQLKKIEANKEYAAKSRRVLLNIQKEIAAPRISLGRLLLQTLQTGSTIVLAGLLLLLIFGGFSVGKYLTPFRLSSLNPEGLRAEADAIDIQIQLTDLNYKETDVPLILPVISSTVSVDPAITKEVAKQAKELGINISQTSTTPTEAVTIEKALEELSK